MSTSSYAAITALISKVGVVIYQDADEQHVMFSKLSLDNWKSQWVVLQSYPCHFP